MGPGWVPDGSRMGPGVRCSVDGRMDGWTVRTRSLAPELENTVYIVQEIIGLQYTYLCIHTCKYAYIHICIHTFVYNVHVHYSHPPINQLINHLDLSFKNMLNVVYIKIL
jgi:hypothetical protein